jgi:integrase
MINSRKNVTLLSYLIEGIRSQKLVGPDGQEIQPFSIFARSLRKVRLNTRKVYLTAMADFFDFSFEAVLHLTTSAGTTDISRGELREIIEAWHPYLVHGVNANDELSKAVAQTLPSPLVTAGTSKIKHVALSHFLRLSERYRKQTAELIGVKQKQALIDYEPLLQEFGKFRLIGMEERRKMIKSSVLGTVVHSGRSKRAKTLFGYQDHIAGEFDVTRAFPLDRFADFVNVLSSYRNKALYCFYAASGCRGHEGLQLLWEDIDIRNGSVRLVSPFSRFNHSSYNILTPKERDLLSWKGRETSNTFLIEPYASMFFENLERYHREEYFPHGRHQFVFQVSRRPDRGRPYFLTDAKTRQQAFVAAAAEVGLPVSVRGPHSLRHAYGTYMVNYIPLIEGGYGMPIGLVRVVMGHASVKSTEKYAVIDKDLVRAQLQFANLQVFHKGETKGQLDFKVKALEEQIVNIRNIHANLLR